MSELQVEGVGRKHISRWGKHGRNMDKWRGREERRECQGKACPLIVSVSLVSLAGKVLNPAPNDENTCHLYR